METEKTENTNNSKTTDPDKKERDQIKKLEETLTNGQSISITMDLMITWYIISLFALVILLLVMSCPCPFQKVLPCPISCGNAFKRDSNVGNSAPTKPDAAAAATAAAAAAAAAADAAAADNNDDISDDRSNIDSGEDGDNGDNGDDTSSFFGNFFKSDNDDDDGADTNPDEANGDNSWSSPFGTLLDGVLSAADLLVQAIVFPFYTSEEPVSVEELMKEHEPYFQIYIGGDKSADPCQGLYVDFLTLIGQHPEECNE